MIVLFLLTYIPRLPAKRSDQSVGTHQSRFLKFARCSLNLSGVRRGRVLRAKVPALFAFGPGAGPLRAAHLLATLFSDGSTCLSRQAAPSVSHKSICPNSICV